MKQLAYLLKGEINDDEHESCLVCYHFKCVGILKSTKCKACIWICHLCYEDVQWLIQYREHFLYALFKITHCFAHNQSICLILNYSRTWLRLVCT